MHVEQTRDKFFNQRYDKDIADKCVCKCDNINDYTVEQAKFQINVMKNLAMFIKDNFSCKFMIVYFSAFVPETNYHNNVLSIKLDENQRYIDTESIHKLHLTIQNNIDLINSIIDASYENYKYHP